jgi:Zn-dependent protease
VTTVHAGGFTQTLKAVRPSPNFAGLVVGTGLFGWLLWTSRWDQSAAVFGFVLFGWVTSVAIHEFAHAFVADLGGDHSVRDKGYLDLDPTRYLDPVLSIAIPVLFLLLGGIGLPGAAVWIDRGALRTMFWRSAVSFAGPLANAILAVTILLPLKLEWVDFEHAEFAAGLAFLGWVQVISVLLNLLPLPGLDGYGTIEPWLPMPVRIFALRFGRFSFLFFIAVLIAVPAASRVFFGAADDVTDALGAPEFLVDIGLTLFRFWEN